MADQAPYSVVFPRMVWERSLRRVLAVPGSYGFGGVTRNAHPEAVELLVHDLEVVTSVPAGGRQPPLTDWVLVGTTRDAAPVSVLNDTIRRFGPRSSQLLAVILAGLDADRGGWVGCVFERGQRLPLAELRIVGPGMLRALAQGAEEDETPSRFSRLIKAVGADVWGKVHRSKLALIGASRNGSTMAFQLAALGVAKLTLIDFDFLEAHHLDCNRAVTEADIGHRKADALAERLLRFRSDLALSVLPCSAADARVIDAVRGVDLLATCVDRDSPRLAAALLAQRFLKVHLDVGTGVSETGQGQPVLGGDMRLLLPGQGCVCCVGGLCEEEGARYELFAPPGALQRGRRRAWHEERLGSLITLNEMTVSAAVQLWLDLLAGSLRTSHWHRLQWVPGGGIRADYGSVTAAPNCRICSMSPREAA